MANGRAGSSNGSKRHGVAVRGSWVPVPIELLRSRAFASLSPLATKLFWDLVSQLHPNAGNNGSLSAARAVLQLRGWVSAASQQAAIAELIAARLLCITRQGGRRRCTLFALTIYPLDHDPATMEVGPGAYASRDWTEARPDAEDVLHPRVLAPDWTDRVPAPAVWAVPRKAAKHPPENESRAPVTGPHTQSMTPPRVNSNLVKGRFGPVAGSKANVSTESVAPPRGTSIDSHLKAEEAT